MKRPFPRLLGYIAILLILLGIIQFFPDSVAGVGIIIFGAFMGIYAGPEYYPMLFIGSIIALILTTACVIPWCYKTNWKTITLMIIGILIWIGSGIWGVIECCLH